MFGQRSHIFLTFSHFVPFKYHGPHSYFGLSLNYVGLTEDHYAFTFILIFILYPIVILFVVSVAQNKWDPPSYLHCIHILCARIRTEKEGFKVSTFFKRKWFR